MAEKIEYVQPGDVISSEFVNDLIDNINDAQSKLEGIDDLLPGPGKVSVPNVFGLSLELAKAELTKPSNGLLLGNVYNTLGVRIFPENTEALVYPVLNQVPDAGKIVPIGSRVNLVIAAQSSGNGDVGGDLEITGIIPPPSVGANVLQQIEIQGNNFLLPFNRNRVFFDGVFESTPLAGSTDKSLIVAVPEDIPNLPREVSISVQAEGVTKVYDELYLIKPKSSDTLTFSRSVPASQIAENQTLTLIGTGFSDVPEENRITFIYNPLLPEPRPQIEVSGESVSTVGEETHLTVTIPDFSNNCPGLPGGCSNMIPAPTGTAYNITIHLSSDPSNKVSHAMVIFPA